MHIYLSASEIGCHEEDGLLLRIFTFTGLEADETPAVQSLSHTLQQISAAGTESLKWPPSAVVAGHHERAPAKDAMHQGTPHAGQLQLTDHSHVCTKRVLVSSLDILFCSIKDLYPLHVLYNRLLQFWPILT